ncbi:FUN14 family-domain-containing protein [Melampsora americana]|nr:FUN14 family-domain-containing protein [Melampsora americana]
MLYSTSRLQLSRLSSSLFQPSPKLINFTRAFSSNLCSTRKDKLSPFLRFQYTESQANTCSRPVLQNIGIISASAITVYLFKPHIRCEDEIPITETPSSSSPATSPPESILSLQKLSFGAVSGICVGIFVRKGLRFLAFLCGAGFVFVQYLHSRSLVDVHWNQISRKYDRFIGHGDRSIGNRFWNFLTADFQARSTFSLGFVLGLRIG